MNHDAEKSDLSVQAEKNLNDLFDKIVGDEQLSLEPEVQGARKAIELIERVRNVKNVENSSDIKFARHNSGER